MTNWQQVALMTRRPGQPVMKPGRYVLCDLSLKVYPGAEPIELSPPDVFPAAPSPALVWRLVDDDTESETP